MTTMPVEHTERPSTAWPSPAEAPAAAPQFRLERSAYTSETWLERERRLLLDRSWALVGDADSVTVAGQYVSVHVGLTPLLVVRGVDGVLRAFVNMCRHRGMALLDGCGTTGGQVTCAYHGWRYDDDGALRVIPQRGAQFTDIDPRDWGLLPASVAVWEGMVFVHADPDAPPLSAALGDLPAHIGSFRAGKLAQVAAVDFEGAFNWKLFVENHVDVYHLWYLHERSLSAYDHPRFAYEQVGRNWASFEPLRPGVLAAGTDDHLVGTEQIAHLDDRDRYGIGAHMLFPNVLIATTAEFFASYAVVPLAPNRSRVELRIRAEPGADGELLARGARGFIDEDVRACEQIQLALASDRFAVGPLAAGHEAPIDAFHRHLLEIVGPDDPADVAAEVDVHVSGPTPHPPDRPIRGTL